LGYRYIFLRICDQLHIIFTATSVYCASDLLGKTTTNDNINFPERGNCHLLPLSAGARKTPMSIIMMVWKYRLTAQFQACPSWTHVNNIVSSHGHFILLFRNSTEFTECVNRDVRLFSGTLLALRAQYLGAPALRISRSTIENGLQSIDRLRCLPRCKFSVFAHHHYHHPRISCMATQFSKQNFRAR